MFVADKYSAIWTFVFAIGNICQVSTSPIVLRHTALLSKIATAHTDDFKLIRIVLAKNRVGHSHYPWIVIGNIFDLPDIYRIVGIRTRYTGE